MHMQIQLKEEVDELTSLLTIKESEIMKLKDDNRMLLKKVSKIKESKASAETVCL